MVRFIDKAEKFLERGFDKVFHRAHSESTEANGEAGFLAESPNPEGTTRFELPPKTEHDGRTHGNAKTQRWRINPVKFRLVVLSGPLSGRVYECMGSDATLGRSESADIVIDDDTVSKLHARISSNGSKWLLTDQQSTNGSFINGQKITGRQLESGDVIKLGQTELRFELMTSGRGE